MNMMKIAALVVTFNRLSQLKTTLSRLLAEPVDHIIVVNNASTDDTQEWLASQEDPRLFVLNLGENLGGAGGFEQGMIEAQQQFDPDWIVLMDDDARPAKGAIARFREQAQEFAPSVGAAAAAVFYPDGTLCEMNRPSRNPFWNVGLFVRTLLQGGRRGFHLNDAAFSPKAPKREIDVASFVGFFVHRDAIQKTGFPEGDLFIYGDDVLYSLRLRRAGLEILFTPAIRFEHDCGTLTLGFVHYPLWKTYYNCRNGVTIARQAAGPIVFPFALAYYTVIWWRRGRFCSGTELKLYRKLMLRGLRDGLLGIRGRNDAIHTMRQTR